MIKDYAIQLGKGFGNIKLGMKEADIEEILGEPDDVDEIVYPDGEVSKTYNYDQIGIDLTFESDNENRLSYISFFDEQFHIMEKIRIGIGKEKIKELAEQVIELTGSKSKLIFNPLPSDDPLQRQPDISLAKKELDWEPKVQLREGLIKTIQYFENLIRNGEDIFPDQRRTYS